MVCHRSAPSAHADRGQQMGQRRQRSGMRSHGRRFSRLAVRLPCWPADTRLIRPSQTRRHLPPRAPRPHAPRQTRRQAIARAAQRDTCSCQQGRMQRQRTRLLACSAAAATRWRRHCGHLMSAAAATPVFVCFQISFEATYASKRRAQSIRGALEGRRNDRHILFRSDRPVYIGVAL